MAQGANVNTDALAAFRVALIKFQESSNSAIGDAESDVQRTIQWLEHDQFSHWSTQIRHRQEALARAQEALRQKKVFKDSTGKTPSAVEEQKAVNKAQQQLTEAQEKMAATKSWSKRLQKEMVMYKGMMQRFTTTVTTDVPAAVSALGALIHTLQEYAAVAPGKEAELSPDLAAYFGAEPGAASMARGKAGEVAAKPFSHLRQRTPSATSRASIAAAAEAPKQWAAPALGEEGVDKLDVKWTPPAATDRVIIARDAPPGSEIFLERILGAPAGDSGWFVGNLVERETKTEAITVADLLAARPDLQGVLALPPGWLVVIEQSGLKAVLNERNDNLWPPRKDN